MFSNMAFGQGYQKQLDDLTGSLLNFDNETYEDIEVKNDILRISLQNNKYLTAKISDLDKAEIDLAKNSVVLKCKSGNCIYTSITGSNQNTFNFSTSTSKNLNKLKDNFNNFLAAYRGETVKTDDSSDDYLDYFLYDLFVGDEEEEEIVQPAKTTTPTNNTTTTRSTSTRSSTDRSLSSSTSINNKYSGALEKLNQYLKTFDNGYYGSLKVEGEYLIDNFKSGDYCKAKISSIDKAVEHTPDSKIIIKCKNGEDCVYSTFTDSRHSQFSFSQSTAFKTSELIDLINKFLASYKSK